MPPKRTPTIATKLNRADHSKFEEYCRTVGRTKTEVAREAILDYIKGKEVEKRNVEETLLEQRLKRMEDRIAALLVKVGLGVYGLEHLFWSRTDEARRKQLFQECHKSGIEKMKNKLAPDEKSLSDAFGE